ncbi:MAG: mucoidy inhibitor MuiA family protein [Pseudomonadota bacterium]
MRLILFVPALVLAGPALADDVFVRADITEAVIYSGTGTAVREETITLDAGRHRVLFPVIGLGDRPPLIEVDGARVLQTEFLHSAPVELGALDNAAQAEARSAVEDAEDVLDAAELALSETLGDLSALDLQLEYLNSLVEGGEAGLPMPSSPGALETTLITLGETAGRLAAERVTIEQEIAARQDDIEDAQEDLTRAEDTLDALRPITEVAQMWAVTLDVAEAGEVALSVLINVQASWRPFYDLSLNTETGALVLDREVALSVASALSWTDVAVTLSTSNPNRALAPREPGPSRAVIQEAAPAAPRMAETDSLAGLSREAIAEPAMIMADTGPGAEINGLSISYPISDPVTIAPDGRAFLDFGREELTADLINRAAPRRDSTAFLIAEVVNDTGAPILPGEVKVFRDGALIGENFLPLIAAGEEIELPFGALDHIQLSWTDLSRDTGDRGVFVSSNTQEQSVRLEIENLSGQPVELEVLYATPFSEQEDLEIDVDSSLPPAETAWEDRRGVYAWRFELSAQASQSIDLDFGFDWPDGQVLIWRP